MKKKNQELEKFKFVLDYKIKELKKQIEPRENDIKAMKEQIQEVRCDYIRYLIAVRQKTQAELYVPRYLMDKCIWGQLDLCEMLS